MNVLLTSAGRRTYLVDDFKEALGNEGLVFASNSAMSPALTRADGYVLTPLIYDADYIPFLRAYCKEKKIGLVVPLFDIDLPVLAAHKAEFAADGVILAVSDAAALNACNDKYEMFRRLSAAGIGTPFTVLGAEAALSALDAGRLSFPLIVKPRFGMGSISILKAEARDELPILCELAERRIRDSYLRYESAADAARAVIVQACCRGQEYGLDVINDFSGNYVTTIVRRKEAMRAGETDEAEVLDEADAAYAPLSALGKRLSECLHHIGNLDADVIMDAEDAETYVIDLNARFGGGYPFSHLAGADLPRAYVAWARGECAEERCFHVQGGVHGYKDMVVRRYGE